MHCRVFKDYLSGAMELISNQDNTSISNLHRKLLDTLEVIDDPVALLGTPNYKGTTKFSVKGTGLYGVFGCALVHLNFNAGGCYVKCQEGLCQTKYLNKKKIPKKVSGKDTDNLCSHLQTFFSNLEVFKVRDLFPEYFGTNNEEEEEEETDQPDTVLLDDNVANEDAPAIKGANISSLVSFDTQSGLWSSTSLSQHKPRREYDPDLVSETLDRLAYIRPGNLNRSDGTYIGPPLKPDVSKAAEAGQCDCGVSVAYFYIFNHFLSENFH
jgi:hypothetical protein